MSGIIKECVDRCPEGFMAYSSDFKRVLDDIECEMFDENYYAEKYVDVRDAVEAGLVQSLREHFFSVGIREGRCGKANAVI
jgi:site-specific DNA-cytosine methylase